MSTSRSDLSTKNDLKENKSRQMNNLVELFCDVEDFCHQFIPQWETQLITDVTRKRRRHSKMSFSKRKAMLSLRYLRDI